MASQSNSDAIHSNLTVRPGGNLEHTSTPGLGWGAYFPGYSDANVLNSDAVNAAILKALKYGSSLAN